jgi:hypothetical protein
MKANVEKRQCQFNHASRCANKIRN